MLKPLPEDHMPHDEVEEKIIKKGKEFFASISQEKQSLFSKNFWVNMLMDWAMADEDFKVKLFRFVDVFPYLNSGKSLTRHIQEYFGGRAEGVPGILRVAANLSVYSGALGSKMLNSAISYAIKNMAVQFIVGENTRQAIAGVRKLRERNFSFIVDLLGEYTVSPKECQEYLDVYLELLDSLEEDQKSWEPLKKGGITLVKEGKDWGYAPFSQISVKPSSLYYDVKPENFEESVEKILEPLEKIYAKVVKMNGAMCIDMESTKYKDITIEVFKRLRANPKYRDYPYLGVVLQAYLKSTERDLGDLLAWARENSLRIEVRLVKGAYWDYETVMAQQNSWPCPVWETKPETDACFERCAKLILENSDICYFACGSHNIRSISAVMVMAEELGVPEDRYEFQVLYGMAEEVRLGLRKVAGRVRLYTPYGKMIPGMGYLVRRLLENTANESFLRQTFVEETEIELLLENPLKKIER